MQLGIGRFYTYLTLPYIPVSIVRYPRVGFVREIQIVPFGTLPYLTLHYLVSFGKVEFNCARALLLAA